MKKQILALALVVVLVFSLVGCGGETASSDAADTSKDNPQTTETKEATSEETTTAIEASSEITAPTIDQAVIYDQDGLKVTAEKIEMDDLGDYSLYLTFENNSSETYELFNGNLMVEDYYVGTYGAIGSIECAAGETKTDCLTIDSARLSDVGMDGLGTMRFPLHFSHEDYDANIDTDYITIETSDSGKYSPVLEDEGIEIINQDGYKVVGLGIKDGIIGKEYKFYIENTNPTNVYLSTENAMQNGAESEFYFSTEIPPMSKCYAESIMSEESLSTVIEAGELTSLAADFVIEKEMFSDEIIAQAAGVELIK